MTLVHDKALVGTPVFHVTVSGIELLHCTVMQWKAAGIVQEVVPLPLRTQIKFQFLIFSLTELKLLQASGE